MYASSMHRPDTRPDRPRLEHDDSKRVLYVTTPIPCDPELLFFLRSMGVHSHELLPASLGVISPPRADMASDPAFLPTTLRLHSAPTSRPRSALSSTTSAPLPPLGSTLSSVLLASPSPSTSAPGVARNFASQSTLQRPPSSPALASSLSPGLRS